MGNSKYLKRVTYKCDHSFAKINEHIRNYFELT